MEIFCRRVTALILLCICVFASSVEAHVVARVVPRRGTTIEGRGLFLVPAPETVLTYHDGPLVTVGPVVPVYLIWYGSFSKAQRATIKSFFASFSLKAPASSPSIRSWWNLTSGYKDTKGTPVAPSLRVAGEVSLAAKNKKALANSDILSLVVRSLKKLPANSNAIYVVLTDADVQLEEFCFDSCASHFASNEKATNGKSLPFIWAGNPGTQCPDLCAWPFAQPQYGPPDFTPLLPPNGDVGIDGLLINLASVLAGTVTNPDDTGYYQGDASAPLEAATACAGTYGVGAYPGNPGQLLTDKATGASFNTYGINNRKYLMPALWNPITSLCTPP